MADIDELAELAGEALQDIQDEIGDRTHVADAVTRFPRGYVRRAGDIYHSLPAIGDNTKRRNFAYQLMRADVCRWLLSRTDIYGQVQSVVVAEFICILAYGVEFFAKTLNYRKVAKWRSLSEHTQRLCDDGVINAALKDDLDWMWNIRTHEHLDATTDLRHCSHGKADFNRAVSAWNDFVEALKKL